MNTIQASKNFKLREFQCRDGSHQVVIHSELLRRLQDLRNRVGRTVIINSGYRNREHNARVGGSPNSYHLRGMAADIVVAGINPGDLARVAWEVGFRGIGIYRTFLHVDVRPNRAKWRG